jgi:hypothetical protein
LLEATSTFFSYFEEDFGLDRLFSLSYHWSGWYKV